eukprot:SAG11_NODE_405_length_9736_cov_5.776486_13_plen_215_part_00
MSEGLSKRLSGTHNVMNNAEAKQFDQMLKRLIPETVLPRLRQMYPEYEWDHVTRVYQRDYVYMTNPSYVPSNPNSHIAPDGGVVLCNCIPVLITEAKKQGTNTKRMQEGKKRQSRGNAIERAHKNFNELRFYTDFYDHFPYLVFCFGCDFVPGSSTIDRLAAMTCYDSYNTLHVIDSDSGSKKASVFVQTEPYSADFIVNQCIEAVRQVIQHLA